jgi:phosphoribosylanthranilate isomerase
MFVKVCGMTCEDDALLAVALGADAVGFVFAPSPRQIAPQIAGDIVKRLPPEIVTVGVFRDESPARVLQVAHLAGLRAVQLHGRESPESARWLSSRLPMVIQAFPAGDARVGRAAEYHAHVILLDAPHPGSGQVFDWSLAAEVPTGQRLMIAGGLTADNVAAAVSRARPWGVDAVSGIEREPGRKDPIRMRDFIATARAAGAALDDPLPDRDEITELYDWQAES